MSLFRLIEGLVSTREVRVLWDFSFSGSVSPATDVLYDFGGLRRDVTIWTDRRISVKFNSPTNPAFEIEEGMNQWTNEYATKVYITTLNPTKLKIFANG